jgi:hypothetical protein
MSWILPGSLAAAAAIIIIIIIIIIVQMPSCGRLLIIGVRQEARDILNFSQDSHVVVLYFKK